MINRRRSVYYNKNIIDKYIQDNCVLFLDGEYNVAKDSPHSNDINGWYDISPNRFFLKASEPLIGDNYYYSNLNDGVKRICKIDVPTNHALDIINNFTIELVSMCSTDQNVIAYGRDHQTSYYNNFFLTSKQLSYWFCNKNITNKGAIEINKTYYTCVTVSGNIAKIYINGCKVDEITFKNSMAHTSCEFGVLGYRRDGKSYAGKIYALRMHNNPLSDIDIAYNYRLDKIRFGF